MAPFVALFSLFLGSASAITLAPPSSLLVESLTAPDGVDATPPRFSWTLLPVSHNTRSAAQSAFELNVYSDAAGASLMYGSGRVASNASSLVTLPLPVLAASTRYYWRVRVWDGGAEGPTTWSSVSTFSTGLFDPADWAPSVWVSGGTVNASMNLLRSSFLMPAGARITSALLHVAGVGAHAAFVNGARAGNVESRLDGGVTHYPVRVLYTTRDVTAELVPGGENVLGVALGNFWYGDAGWYKRPPYPFPSAANGGGFSFAAPLQARVLLVVRFADGSTSRIATTSDGTWAGARGDVSFDSLYDGEDVDGLRRAALAGWAAPGFTPTPGDWSALQAAPTSAPATNASLSSALYEPMMSVSETQALRKWEALDGSTVFDFGANDVGVVRWTLRGLDAGTRITARYAEVAQHPPYGPSDGSLYYGSLRNALQTDTFIAAGADVEVFEPTFTAHGFRYAQVWGLPASLPLSDAVAVRIHNAVPPGADVAFPATASVLAAVQAACVASIGSNLQGGPGSCGARDERQFFTGDTAVTVHASLQNFRLRALLASWARTGVDNQNEDGSIGYYLPTPNGDVRNGSPQWSTGFPHVLHELVALEGDLATARAAFPALLRYIDFNERVYYNESMRKCGSLACYTPVWPAEWQQNGPGPNASCVNAGGYIRDLRLAGDIASALGEVATSTELHARAAARRAEFHAAFFSPANGTYGAGTDTEVAIALAESVPPTSSVAATLVATLSAAVAARNYSVDVGIVGGRAFWGGLAGLGLSRMGLHMLLRTEAPSYGYMVAGVDNLEPSETLWELWRGDVGSAIMSSRNHLMFASVSSFLLDLAAGVIPSAGAAGWAAGARIAPAGWGLLDPALPEAAGWVATPRGRVSVSWSNVAGGGPPAPSTPAPCGQVSEVGTLVLGCSGALVTNVTFAAFGTPTGSCATGWTRGACDAHGAAAIVASACLGRASCALPVTVAEFGGVDPCEGVKKSLAVSLSCGPTPSPPPSPPLSRPLGALNVTIPPGLGAATVVIPAFNASSAGELDVTEGGTLVWRAGTFVAGVPGVRAGGSVAAPALDGGFALELTVDAGVFAFAVSGM